MESRGQGDPHLDETQVTASLATFLMRESYLESGTENENESGNGTECDGESTRDRPVDCENDARMPSTHLPPFVGPLRRVAGVKGVGLRAPRLPVPRASGDVERASYF
jgi:hypothetical protein